LVQVNDTSEGKRAHVIKKRDIDQPLRLKFWFDRNTLPTFDQKDLAYIKVGCNYSINQYLTFFSIFSFSPVKRNEVVVIMFV